jgi:hypothetical protein
MPDAHPQNREKNFRNREKSGNFLPKSGKKSGSFKFPHNSKIQQNTLYSTKNQK